MKEQLQLLEQLQEIDLQIERWEQELARLPSEAQDVARNLVGIRRDITEAKDKLAVLEKDLRRKEQDLATEQDKIKRSERRLLGIKNQKEYNALNKEIKLGKKVVSELEDSVITLMAQVDGLRSGLERKEKEYQDFEKALLEKKTEVDQTSAGANEALSILNSEREGKAVSIDRDLLKKYETVKKVRGNALVEVHNGSCSGCHMAIPAQLAISVLKQEEMITCPNCHRILYVKPENIPEHNKLGS